MDDVPYWLKEKARQIGYNEIERNNEKELIRVFLIAEIVIVLVFAGLILFKSKAFADTVILPPNFCKGLIAEDTRGNYQTYLAITSVVRNRYNAGLNTGLVALKRKDLDKFVKTNSNYMLTKNVDLQKLAERAIIEVFNNGKDYANKATHYEHTGIFPTPKWAKYMQVVKVMFSGTKREITFYRKRQ